MYRFNWDCGRNGDLEGLCILDSDLIKKANGVEVYFGEVLGKHSEIAGTIEETDFTLVTEDEKVIDVLLPFGAGRGTMSGFNPFDYLEDAVWEDLNA